MCMTDVHKGVCMHMFVRSVCDCVSECGWHGERAQEGVSEKRLCEEYVCKLSEGRGERRQRAGSGCRAVEVHSLQVC